MDTLAKADIFFFITTIAVVVFTVGFVVIFVYLLKILRDINNIIWHTQEKVSGILEEMDKFADRMRRREATSILRIIIKALLRNKRRKF